MSLAWKLKRLSVMGPAEVAYRATRAAQAMAERYGMGRARMPAPAGNAGRRWLEELPQDLEAAPYVHAADRILAGRFDVFALRDLALGFPPQWNRDPKTGRTAPLVFGKTLDYRDDRVVGDIKYLWEPSRHLELVTLAQAWHVSHEPRYAHGCRQLLMSWFAQCPYPLGVHWSSSLEHGYRLVNWSFAWHLLGGEQSVAFEGDDGVAFRSAWLRSIFQHCHFIAGHLSRHSSANNHLLGELAGLFIGSTTWPLWPQSRAWQRQAHEEFSQQALLQTYRDGVNREQATWYHHSVADLMLHVGLVGRANDRPFGDEFWQRLRAMVEFIASIRDVNGNVPRFGDADDGVLVRWDPRTDFDVFQSLLATGAVLFESPGFARKAGRVDDKTRWLLGDGPCAGFAPLAGRPAAPLRRTFPEGGYFVFGDSLDSPGEVRIVADAGPLGYGAIAAHGHADALSFTLGACGREILVDSGTFAYHSSREWRDYFRGTAAHNTVRIDGADQSESGGNFLWTRHAHAHVERFREEAGVTALAASQDGYEALRDPVRHRRTFEYRRDESSLGITDEIDATGQHEAEWFWHFAHDCRVSVTDRVVVAQTGDVTVQIFAPEGLEIELVRAREGVPLGWISRRLDSLLSSSVAVFRGRVHGSTKVCTRIHIRRAAVCTTLATRSDPTE